MFLLLYQKKIHRTCAEQLNSKMSIKKKSQNVFVAYTVHDDCFIRQWESEKDWKTSAYWNSAGSMSIFLFSLRCTNSLLLHVSQEAGTRCMKIPQLSMVLTSDIMHMTSCDANDDYIVQLNFHVDHKPKSFTPSWCITSILFHYGISSCFCLTPVSLYSMRTVWTQSYLVSLRLTWLH